MQCNSCENPCYNCIEISSKCIDCIEGYYLSINTCLNCDENCKSCIETATQCTNCEGTNYLRPDNVCGECPNEYYYQLSFNDNNI